MPKKIIINITDEKYEQIQAHFSKEAAVNAKEETFSGFSINLQGAEWGISWLEVSMNSTIDVGEVDWKFE